MLPFDYGGVIAGKHHLDLVEENFGPIFTLLRERSDPGLVVLRSVAPSNAYPDFLSLGEMTKERLEELGSDGITARQIVQTVSALDFKREAAVLVAETSESGNRVVALVRLFLPPS